MVRSGRRVLQRYTLRTGVRRQGSRVQRLREAGVPYEELIIPDDTHHWMLHANAIRVNRATAEFFDRTTELNALVAALDRWRNWGYLTSASIRGRTP